VCVCVSSLKKKSFENLALQYSTRASAHGCIYCVI
jgi:hypothetical protein